jgi:hypothetical protein
MLLKQACLGTIAAASLGLLAGPSHAAAVATANAAARPDAAAVQNAAFRRCWFEDGVRHCRLIPGPYDDDLGYDDNPGYDDEDYYGGAVYWYGPDDRF